MKIVISEADATLLFATRGFVTKHLGDKLRARGVDVDSTDRIVGKWLMTYNDRAKGWELWAVTDAEMRAAMQFQ